MSELQNTVRALCGSEARFRLVKAFYEAPQRAYHLRGLAAAATVDPSQVHKLLRQFLAAGLCEQVDDLPYAKYRAGREHPLHEALVQVFSDNAGRQTQEEAAEVDLNDAPVLRTLLWTGRKRERIPAQEAFRHYEKNWRFVRRAPIDAKEQLLIDRLAKTYGGGLING